MNLFAYWNADKMVLSHVRRARGRRALGARVLRAGQRLAAAAGLPMPRVYVIDNPQPNAFATGRNPAERRRRGDHRPAQHRDREEIAGVMAHELGHVKNRDTLIMTITATIAGAISMLANFGFFFGGRSNDNNNLGFIGVLALLILAPLAAVLVQMAISRTREYEADRAGAEISGQSACRSPRRSQKIAGAAAAHPQLPAERNPATAHLFIVNPLSGERMDNLFSTHPNVENRIARLAGDGARDGRERPPASAPARRRPWSSPQRRVAGRGPWG